MPKPITAKDEYEFISTVREANDFNPKIVLKDLERAIRWKYGTSKQTVDRHVETLVALEFIRIDNPHIEILVNGYSDKFAKTFFEKTNMKKYDSPKEVEE